MVLDDICALVSIKVNTFFYCGVLPTQLDQPVLGRSFAERLAGKDSEGWEDDIVEAVFKFNGSHLSFLLLKKPCPSRITDGLVLQN
jgi:hypothetical protein